MKKFNDQDLEDIRKFHDSGVGLVLIAEMYKMSVECMRQRIMSAQKKGQWNGEYIEKKIVSYHKNTPKIKRKSYKEILKEKGITPTALKKYLRYQ